MALAGFADLRNDVNDCTGFIAYTSTLTGPPREVRGDFVIVDGGQEIFFLDNSDNWVANGVGKRL